MLYTPAPIKIKVKCRHQILALMRPNRCRQSPMNNIQFLIYKIYNYGYKNDVYP